ncbi:MAG: MarR family transcriptional regulator [Gemmatimonadetes bacterium]|nr:MarR family transcriptional regulator [Gemmatimonadota bacterium]
MSALHTADVEAIVRHGPAGHKAELRLWLRLLSCTNLVTTAIRRRFRSEFGVTLPQFDLMAQLHREPAGLRLGELSARMMVTNGNITGLVTRLAAERLVRRNAAPDDGRVAVVVLTSAGARLFARMARAHESWIADLFAKVGRRRATALTNDLRLVKDSVRGAIVAGSGR